MSTTDRLEAFAVAAALTRAELEHDTEAWDVVLDGADLAAVCRSLARVTVAVLRSASGDCDRCTAEFVSVWQSDIRRGLAAITEE